MWVSSTVGSLLAPTVTSVPVGRSTVGRASRLPMGPHTPAVPAGRTYGWAYRYRTGIWSALLSSFGAVDFAPNLESISVPPARRERSLPIKTFWISPAEQIPNSHFLKNFEPNNADRSNTHHVCASHVSQTYDELLLATTCWLATLAVFLGVTVTRFLFLSLTTTSYWQFQRLYLKLLQLT